MKHLSCYASIAHKFLHMEEIEGWRQALVSEGKTLVLATGVFDLLHVGHVEFIYQAAQQADVLVIALNSDESVRLYKESTRPVIPLEQRALLVASLPWVDHVIFLMTRDGIPVIEKLHPHVFVNGSEYSTDYVEAGFVAKNMGRIHVVERIPAFSTSAIIHKVRSSCAS